MHTGVGGDGGARRGRRPWQRRRRLPRSRAKDDACADAHSRAIRRAQRRPPPTSLFSLPLLEWGVPPRKEACAVTRSSHWARLLRRLPHRLPPSRCPRRERPPAGAAATPDERPPSPRRVGLPLAARRPPRRSRGTRLPAATAQEGQAPRQPPRGDPTASPGGAGGPGPRGLPLTGTSPRPCRARTGSPSGCGAPGGCAG
ncbi:hypothetical protein I4F81_011560 [Pyropia yezoensis]|uniref:Uncharacterized protein n=1 Tax=Pyropia yezoensis TaxID=2788 RepID=A0ACC3CG68_PYRYE|nr:hypothetical protein I4F81_011560 [Neopyropia yezoensis]